MNKKYISLLIALAIVGNIAVVMPAFAQNAGQPVAGRGFSKGVVQKVRNEMGVAGKVTAVNGTTITLTSIARPSSSGGTGTLVIYTIGASGATVTKGGVFSSVSAIALGDEIMVQGTVVGTNVIAKTIKVAGVPAQIKETATNNSTSKLPGGFRGMMGGVGNFFKRMFGL